MMIATWSQHRFMISAKKLLLKLLPTKMTNRTWVKMDSFGMTNNFISRYSKNIAVR